MVGGNMDIKERGGGGGMGLLEGEGKGMVLTRGMEGKGMAEAAESSLEDDEALTPLTEWGKIGVHLILATTQIIYALYSVFASKLFDSSTDPIVFSATRDVMAGTLMMLGLLVRGTTTKFPSWKLVRYIAVVGLVGVALNQVLFLFGLKYASASTASAMQPAIPVFTFILGLMLGMETVNILTGAGRLKIMGVLACCMGASCIATYRGDVLIGVASAVKRVSATKALAHVTHDQKLEQFRHNVGVLCLLGNCFCMAFYLTVQKRILKVYTDAYALTAFTYACGACFVALMGLALSPRDAWHLSKNAQMLALYAAIFPSAMNNFILSWANQHVGPGTVSLYLPLQPLGTSVIGYFLYNKAIYSGIVIGGSIILFGLISFITAQKAELQAKEAKLAKLEGGDTEKGGTNARKK